MEEKKIKLVFRRGSLGLKITVLLMVVLSMAVLLTVWLMKQDAQQEYDALKETAVVLEQENSRLEQRIGELGTIGSVVQIAMERLGLVPPDAIIIEPEQ